MGKKNFKKKGGKNLLERKKELKEALKDDVKRSSHKKSSGPSPSYTTNQLLDKAEELIDEFNYELAQKFCQRALERDADNVRALETSGSLLLELGQPEAAKQCFGRAVEVCPDTGYSKYMNLGQLFEGEQAVQCFMKGIHLMLQDKTRMASGALRNPEGEGPTDQEISSAYCSVAEIYLTDLCEAAEAEAKCEDCVKKALEADPSNPEAHQLHASCLLSKDRKEEAAEAIKKSVSLWLPQLQEAERGNVAEAEFDPVEPSSLSLDARIQAGKILIEVGEYELSTEVLELLLDEDEDVADVWYMLGWAHYLQGPDYASNARHYLHRAQQVHAKTKHEDQELLKHITDLLEELGPGDADEDLGDNTAEGDVEIESSDEEGETQMDQ